MDLKKIWQSAKKQIADRVSSVSFDLWIKTLTPEAFEDGAFILSATSTMAKQQATNERHFTHIEAVIKDVAPIVEQVIIIDAVEKEKREGSAAPVPPLEILSATPAKGRGRSGSRERGGAVTGALEADSATARTARAQGYKQSEVAKRVPEPAESNERASVIAPPPHLNGTLVVNPNQTFNTFIVGKSNEIVAAAAEAVAKNLGRRINPLFIYGGSGLGKTHLLNAIANLILHDQPKIKIAFVTSEKFTNDYVATMRQKDKPVTAFREKYRTVDILLIDDIQFIRDKQGTQEEFFNTFNDLIQNGKQIVITSDRHPDEMPTLEDRMRSRFKSGLIQDITTPDVEMRMAILQKKANLENYRLNDKVLSFLATNATEQRMNIRDMEGTLHKVIFYAGLRNKQEPSLDDCYEALKHAQDNSKHQTTADTIIGHVCKYFNVTRDDIIGKRRIREFVEPRMFAIYLITEFLNIPLINIGQTVGGRDHTTVMHARNKIATQLGNDPRTKRIVNDISKMIKEE